MGYGKEFDFNYLKQLMACSTCLVKGVSCMFGKHKVTLIAIHLYPIYFALSSILVRYITKRIQCHISFGIVLSWLFFLMMGQFKNK